MATIAGLISRVRPVGEPWRPLKLRLDDEALIWRPVSLSGFIARHIEQPAWRHSKPWAMNTRSRPSASAAFLTASLPGTMKALTEALTCPPWARMTRAASRRSLMRPLVHEPMKATSMATPAIGWPALKSM